MKRYLLFIFMCVLTLVAVAICNAIGVGASWPFAVIGGLLVATVISGIWTCT